MIKRNKRRLVPSLNTTSTADISFMLLIFFLVTTSMDLDKGLRRVLPPVDNQQQQQETNIDKDKLMAITITDADSAFVDGKPLEMKASARLCGTCGQIASYHYQCAAYVVVRHLLQNTKRDCCCLCRYTQRHSAEEIFEAIF